MREQRERARLLEYVGNDQVREIRFHPQAGDASRSLDRSPQFVGLHLGEDRRAGLEQTREVGKGAAASEEVGPQRQHDRHGGLAVRRGIDDGRDETSSLGGVAADGEDFLELIDDQQRSSVRRRAGGRHRGRQQRSGDGHPE